VGNDEKVQCFDSHSRAVSKETSKKILMADLGFFLDFLDRISHF
jgi:hypothetical protein